MTKSRLSGVEAADKFMCFSKEWFVSLHAMRTDEIEELRQKQLQLQEDLNYEITAHTRSFDDGNINDVPHTEAIENLNQTLSMIGLRLRMREAFIVSRTQIIAEKAGEILAKRELTVCRNRLHILAENSNQSGHRFIANPTVHGVFQKYDPYQALLSLNGMRSGRVVSIPLWEMPLHSDEPTQLARISLVSDKAEVL